MSAQHELESTAPNVDNDRLTHLTSGEPIVDALIRAKAVRRLSDASKGIVAYPNNTATGLIALFTTGLVLGFHLRVGARNAQQSLFRDLGDNGMLTWRVAERGMSSLVQELNLRVHNPSPENAGAVPVTLRLAKPQYGAVIELSMTLSDEGLRCNRLVSGTQSNGTKKMVAMYDNKTGLDLVGSKPFEAAQAFANTR